jgi:D-alanyl-D-alanine carboxypeptidase
MVYLRTIELTNMTKLIKFALAFSLLFLIVSLNCLAQGVQVLQDRVQLPDSVRLTIDSMFARLATQKSCGATVRISNGQGDAHYFGIDGRTHRPLPANSGTIDIGSITKMFTATSIHQLIEQGRISLDTRLVDILPDPALYKGLLEIDGRDYIDSVRIVHLLNHSSGFGDYFYKDDLVTISQFGDSSLRFTPRQLISMAKRLDKPKFKPGGGFSYSNVNYLLLGMIIEKLTGMAYQRYIQQHILAPSGMKSTWFASVNPPPGRTPGHFKQAVAQMPATMAGAAGEIISTLGDMNTFLHAWNGGKFFKNPSTIKRIRQEYFQSMGTPIIQYGLGVIWINERSFGHAGQTFGFQAYAGILQNGYSFVFAFDDASVEVWTTAIALTSILSAL